MASVVGQTNKCGAGGFRESNGEIASSETKGNMRKRNTRIGNECDLSICVAN